MEIYEIKLQAFADLVRGAEQAYVHDHRDGRLITSQCLRTERGQSCDCCGTKRLRVRYPIVKGGRIYWVGNECLSRLLNMACLKPYSIFSSPTVDIK